MEVLDCGSATESAAHLPEDEDLQPEYCNYRDEGCEYATACLRCPFPQCLYDEPRGRQRWMKTLRDREIARRFKAGEKAGDLAENFEVSLRTVQRAINKREKGKGNKE
jgi:hypothetical protein